MTREDILLTAAQIFRLKGFHAASMQDIADAVHLRKASLYHHVSSKQEILGELLDRALDLMIGRMETILALPTDPAEKLSQAVHAYLETIFENRDLAAVLILEFRSLEGEHRARHLPRRDHFEALWRQLIEEAIAYGRFARQDASIAAKALLGTMNYAITWFRPDGPQPGPVIAQKFVDLFLSGLLVR